MEKPFFIVACKSIYEAVKVISFANKDTYSDFEDAVKQYMYDADDDEYLKDNYLIGERGYEDWDFENYLTDELEAGKFIHIFYHILQRISFPPPISPIIFLWIYSNMNKFSSF